MNRIDGDADNRLAIASIASAAAGVLHATAAGIHAEHPELARLFVVLAVAQLSVAVWGFVAPAVSPRRRWRPSTRSRSRGGSPHGSPGSRGSAASRAPSVHNRPTPSPPCSPRVAPLMAVVALARRMPAIPSHTVTVVAVAAGVLVIPGLVNATNHDHAGHDHTETVAESVLHDHGTDGAATGAAAAALAVAPASESTPTTVHVHDRHHDRAHGQHARHGPGSRPAAPL